MEDIFFRNLRAIKEKDKNLAFALESLTSMAIPILKSKSGLPVVATKEDEKMIPLDSLEDPLTALQRELKELETKDINRWIIVGLGSGYRLLEVMKIAQEKSNFLLVEFDLLCLKHTLSVLDLSGLINIERFRIYWNQKQDFKELYEKFFDRKNFLKSAILIENSASKVRNEKHCRINDFIRYYSRKFTIDLEATETSFWLVLKNQLLNLESILRGNKVKSLFGKFSKFPVIIVSAGPSLDRNIDLLRKLGNRSLIISVDTAARVLYQEGLIPHFIVSADPFVKNYFHFINLDPVRSFLVMEPRINPKIPEKFRENIFIASFNFPFMKLIERSLGDFGELETWGSVSSMAFDLALRMGCEPIIFIGQDLAYTGNRQYCREVYFEQKSESIELFERCQNPGNSFDRIVKSRKLIKTRDTYGHEIYSEEMMLNYAFWLSEKIKKSGIRCINATEGGILKENVDIVPFERVVSKELGKEMDISSVILECRDKLSPNAPQIISSEIDIAAKTIEEISSFCFEALKIKKPQKGETSDYHRDYGNKLEAIRREIMQKVANDPYAGLLNEANEKTFFAFQQNVSKSGVDMDTIFNLF
ncbi:DUF115 domain-containing protein, partial [bacterium]|nr:DUF115 domain-containing protein [bacterium]